MSRITETEDRISEVEDKIVEINEAERKKEKRISFLYSPTLTSIYDHWKTIALTRRTFVGKVMSLLFNMLSRLVITFLPRSKRLLISWMQSPSTVILEPRKIKSATVSPSISHEVMGPDAMILIFTLFHFHQEAP